MEVPLDPALQALVRKVTDGVAEMEAVRLAGERYIDTPIEPSFTERRQAAPEPQTPPTPTELEEDDFYAFKDPFGTNKRK
ncbi:hypothetical protein BST43_19465 [Mycobacteroides saopaulense]|uniref:Uncharacterized protein n=1 Tax=Mycobacteroides saopaulense TaxID=1578165 RepID=A0A1X0ITK4_9MYCO|nr:hypothetical protein [Mycobacteroides saopaulense]ORB52172.1 hypothetical protein BST43_19465 [Mycobacteroides saopaulense]